MFGTFRLFLAFAVLLSHQAAVLHAGSYAVAGFFILSGYLMTLVINKKYQGRLKDFAITRVFRVYPVYLVVTVGTAIAWIAGAPFAAQYGVLLPYTWQGVTQHLAMIDTYELSSLNPPVWALTVEVIWWAVMGLGISASKERSLAWLSASLVYAFSVSHLPLLQRYYGVMDASLPFAMGAMLFWHFDRIAPVARKTWAIALALVVGNWWWHFVWGGLESIGWWLNMLLMCWLIAGLATFKPARLDSAIGVLSYPIYVVHVPVAAIVGGVLGLEYGWPLFFAALPPTLAASWLLWRFVDLPINRFRKSLKET